MDPDATLRAIQETEDPEELDQHCRDLYRWLRKLHGFAPAWHKSPEGTERYKTFLVCAT